MVEQPSVEDTISILRGIRDGSGAPRRAHPDAALVAAATLSDRYITDRFLPTSIDLVTSRAP